MSKKNCIECGEPFMGRSDKKFCSDNCRTSFNNKLNRANNSLIRNTNNRLKKNWRILEKLNPSEKRTVHKKQLLNLDFDFNHVTSIYTTKAGQTYYFCYNQGYLPIDNDYYALVKKNYSN